MADNDNSATAGDQNADDGKRFRSEIGFPYADLESAEELAKTIKEKAGSSCEVDELAAWMGQSASGGTFRTRLGAAKMFGLIDTAQGRATLTPLGHDVAEKSQAARVSAFLNVELFRAMYEQFKARTLPPPPAIERQVVELGVSPKQKDRARQTFMKSAQYAGFIDSATGRFVKPGIAQSDAPPKEEKIQKEPLVGGGGGSGGDLNLDPLLIELLKKIPETEKGWPAAQRLRWFRTFAMNVSQIYDGDESPVEMKIDLEEPVPGFGKRGQS
jgi:hypothetical protein